MTKEMEITMAQFKDLGLSKDALKAVEKLGYENPTPVQEQSIPIVLKERDLIAAASTGTGKTAAFLLPALSKLPRAGRGKRAPRVLIVTPTRELAQQIAYTGIKIARATGHFCTTVYGGTPYRKQISELRGGTDVLIATPGRLKDLMSREDVVDLSKVEVLVLDEADRMLDMGFLPDVTDIVNETPVERQTLLFSATIDRSIKDNLGSLLVDPEIVQIAQKGETAKTVKQYIMPCRQKDKPELITAVLDEKGHERVIIFVRTRDRADDVTKDLRDAGFSAEAIHSNKSQGNRRHALDNFRKGKTDMLVATDVLARGIDVSGVDHVINYDLPDMAEDYIHRIGRTGRAGEEGFAISFVTPDTMRLLRDIERLTKREIPFMNLETYELNRSILEQRKAKSSDEKSGGRKSSKRSHGGKGGGRRGENRNKKRYEREAAKEDREQKKSGGNKRSERKNNDRFEGRGGREERRSKGGFSFDDHRDGRKGKDSRKRTSNRGGAGKKGKNGRAASSSRQEGGRSKGMNRAERRAAKFGGKNMPKSAGRRNDSRSFGENKGRKRGGKRR